MKLNKKKKRKGVKKVKEERFMVKNIHFFRIEK
jgi:hypothetical protein